MYYEIIFTLVKILNETKHNSEDYKLSEAKNAISGI